MGVLVLQPTEIAQWYAIVNEAEFLIKLELDQDIEKYLVLMLTHYCKRTDIVGCTVGIDYLKALHMPYRLQQESLRSVADICLIYNGFYSEYLQKSGRGCRYYQMLGTRCYHMIFELFGAQLYENMAHHYLDMCHVLQSMKKNLHNDQQAQRFI